MALQITLVPFVVILSFTIIRFCTSTKETGQENANSWKTPCYLTGHWKLKDGITNTMLRNRRRLEEDFRTYFGFPRKFFRADGRCGPNTTLSHSSLYALCDEESATPCCNFDKGYCGGDVASFCRCPNCVDPRMYLPAMLSEWKPKDKKCRYEHFTQEAACDLLNKNLTDVIFIGDCLMNHLYLGFAVIVTNDALQGGLDKSLNSHQLKQCQGEFQFFDSGKFNCHQRSGVTWNSLGGNRTICKGLGTFNMSYTMSFDTSPSMSMRAARAIERLLNKRGTFAVLGIGHHVDFNSFVVQENYLNPLVRLVKQEGNGWPKMIWISIQSIDAFPRKNNVNFNERVRSYNEDMRVYCQNNDILVLDMFNLTSGVRSYDGIHFGIGVQLTKVQVLLNFLENYIKSPALDLASRSTPQFSSLISGA